MKSKSLTTTRNTQKAPDLLPLITPGEYLVEEFLGPLGITPNALSMDLHVPGTRIQAIIKGHRAITADTALRLAQYFGTTPDFWLNLQTLYELDKARREKLEQIQTQVKRRPPGQEQSRAKAGQRGSRD